MKYVSIDIETTGLDPETCQTIQIGAVIEDTNNPLPIEDLPRFKCLVEHPQYTGSPFALVMNKDILAQLGELERANKEERAEIRKRYNILPEGLVAKSLGMWLQANGLGDPESKTGQIRITVAGKNFATFDKLFLQKLSGWSTSIQIRQRMIDPTILCMDWTKDDGLPNLAECMKRAGVEGAVTHDALQDAIDVVRVMRGITDNYTKITF